MIQNITYKIGQLYKSKGEPELGLGHIVTIDDKTITLVFPKSEETRIYNRKNSPISRVLFQIGHKVLLNTEKFHEITNINGNETELIQYQSHELNFYESEIFFSSDEQIVVERFLDGEWDTPSFFQLRYETLWHQLQLKSFGPWGLLGPKIDPLPHQFYLAEEITKRPNPRVMLADEVGLGKTIEAGLIIHKMITTKAISRVLIIPPAPLVNQWFVEMYQLFNMHFQVVEEEGTFIEDIQDNDSSEDDKEFAEDLTWDNLPLVITSLDYLASKENRLESLFSSSWDLLVIDEAHRLEWTKDGPSMAYELVESLAHRIPGLLLLSATPEQLGPQGHFARLKLIDPQRFHSFNQYIHESKNYHQLSHWIEKIQTHGNWDKQDIKEMKDFLGESAYHQIEKNSKLSVEEKIKILIDHHGPGRIYFRNTRKSLTTNGLTFPERILFTYPLNANSNDKEDLHQYMDEENTWHFEKLDWITHFIQNNIDKKILVITKYKKNVLAIESKLRKANIDNIGLFHSQMSHIERDAQAQEFLNDSHGPRILLSTELGSEGRNFQKCSDIILFDIPKDPDLLEQRIGRLDRMGQKNNVNIHVPYIKNTFEELLLDWYHRGLNIFKSPSPSASQVFAQLQKELKLILLKPAQYFQSQKWELFLTKTHQLDLSLKNDMEKGRDRLVEIQSFHKEKAFNLISQIQKWEGSHYLEDYIDNVFHLFNIQQNDLNEDKDIFHIKPGENMLIPSFPHLPPKGFSASFNRTKIVDNINFQLLSWDHPLVSGIMDFITTSPLGNVSVCGTHKKQSFGNNPFLLELVYTWIPMGKTGLQVERYMPIQIQRIVIDSKGKTLKDFSDYEEWQLWDDLMITLKPSDLKLSSMAQLKEFLRKWPKSELETLLKKAQQFVDKKMSGELQALKNKVEEKFQTEIERLIQLKKNNLAIRTEEIQILENHQVELKQIFEQTSIKLDALRLIILI